MIGEYNLNLLFLLFFGTFLSYNYQRIIFHIKLKKKHSISWFFGNKKLIFLIAMAGILFLCCFFQLKTITKLMVILLSSVSLFYPVLRKIPFLKILLISFSWAYSTVALIYFENNLDFNQNYKLSIISRIFFILGITIPFDIRDIKHDHLKINTIPLVFGVGVAKKVALTFLVIYLCIECYLNLEVFALNFIISASLCFLYSFFIISQLNNNNSDYYYSFWLESCSISLLVFLIITSILL
ncbi:MAG: hypothetical protein CMD09_02055 [Flavobacteriales bacterium]|jgi:4-hydroxybenzoate polyprenyltransferase|nr:hypothetical protein [Flavobacteriales bacterium]OUW96592.1 MAG: hypothetical protein CBD88_03740 [Flavobacteriales bacterium TMED228]